MIIGFFRSKNSKKVENEYFENAMKNIIIPFVAFEKISISETAIN